MNLKTKYLILLTSLLTAVENKIPNVNNLVKKLAIIQKLKKKLALIMIMINIILIVNLIN